MFISFINDDSNEHVIYDGHWQVGDSLTCKDNTQTYKSVIMGIDSIYIGNYWYKIFHFSGPYNSNFFDVIEGLGSLGGPGYPAYFYTFEHDFTPNMLFS